MITLSESRNRTAANAIQVADLDTAVRGYAVWDYLYKLDSKTNGHEAAKRSKLIRDGFKARLDELRDKKEV